MARTKSSKRKAAGLVDDDVDSPASENDNLGFTIDVKKSKVRDGLQYQAAPAQPEAQVNGGNTGDVTAEQSEDEQKPEEVEMAGIKVDKGKGKAVEPTAEELEALKELEDEEVDGVDVLCRCPYF